MVVVSSLDMAREVMKTHDLAFASRPKLVSLDIIFYKSTDIAFSSYGEYWRQMRKICVLELFTAKNVRSFSSIRRDEASSLVQFIRSSTRGEPINVTEQISWYESSNTSRAAFGKLLKDQEKFIGLVKELVELASGFSVADFFPSIKILHVLSGVRSRILKVHKNVDAIVEDVINEHKKNIASGKKGNGAFGGSKEKRLTKDVKRNSERKKSILHGISKSPEIEAHAKLAMLGAATNKKNEGLSMAGRRLLPDNR
uniref:Cytochrome P450 hydroxylase n=1 Tax=Solanum tuberosum TaxID=4113 RepID=M1A230_SOLTU